MVATQGYCFFLEGERGGGHGTLNPMAASILYPPQKFNDNSPLGTMWVLSYDPNRDRERDRGRDMTGTGTGTWTVT